MHCQHPYRADPHLEGEGCGSSEIRDLGEEPSTWRREIQGKSLITSYNGVKYVPNDWENHKYCYQNCGVLDLIASQYIPIYFHC